MTAAELIQRLQEVDPESIVYVLNSTGSECPIGKLEADEDDDGPFVYLIEAPFI